MIIYKITNTINGKIYIGQTTQILRKRKDNHLADSKRERGNRASTKISKAIKKYGIDNFQFDEIYKAVDMQDLNNAESHLISLYKSNEDENGYNLLSGGHQNGKHSDESKKKISEASKRVARGLNGNHWNKGRKATPEKTRKASESAKSASNPRIVPVVQMSLSGEFLNRFFSASEASRVLNIHNSGNICSCCQGKLKTAYGFKWIYESNYKTA